LSFFNELKRRNVFRVGIAYGVAAWLLIQVADTVFPRIGLSESAVTLVIALLGIGFIPALIFAWAFELTPGGVKRESRVDKSQSITAQTGRKLDRAIIVILALALGYFAWDKYAGAPGEAASETAAEQPLDKSIAVLPFVNMSSDQENEYFSDGLSEELLNLLAKVDGLKVAARTSSFKFKGKEADIAEIGEKLKVATVLEGSVRRAGNTARITAQLIKVDDGYHLWSETYDRELDNIFQVQDEIARAIVDALKLPLLGQGQTAIASTAATSFEAYDLYLLGRHHFRSRNEAGFEKAIDYFTQATAIDPGYAPAWSGLADAYVHLSDFGTMARDESIPLAEKALARAEALAPDAVDTIIARAALLNYTGLGTSRAVPLLEAALVSNPNNVRVLTQLSQYLDNTQAGQALEFARRAYELDPLAETTRVMLAGNTFSAGDFEGAEALVREMLLDDPRNPGLHETWGNQLMARGQLAQAIAKYEMVHELRPGDVYPAWRIVQCYLMMDDAESAERWYGIARERGPNSVWTRIAGNFLNFNRSEWETLAANYAEEIAGGESNPSIHGFYGRALLRVGRTKEAEAQFRTALDLLGLPEEGLVNEDQADAIESLANVLEPGEERSQLLGRLRDYVHVTNEVRPRFISTQFYNAALANLEDDRDGVMAALQRAVDMGATYAHGLENNTTLGRWRDDPMFREILAGMRQNAARQRELLEAGP